MPATLIPEVLPPGWSHGQSDARRDALRLFPRRVRVLLAAEWAREELSVFEGKHGADDRPRKAVEAAEKWAVNPTEAAAHAAANAAYAAADAADAYAAHAAYAAAYAAYAAANAAYAADAAAHAAADAAAHAAADAADAAAYAAAYAAHAADAAAYAAYAAAYARKNKWRWLHATYRHARGPEGLAFDPSWRTGTAVSLARGVVEDRAFDRMPYLADALQDAGCDCPELMAHLQADRGEWTLADWCLWNLLGIGEEF